MQLEFTEEEQAFREEVRTFLRESLPREISDKVLNGFELSREDYVAWQRRLHERGWGGMSWPVEFGGAGWNAVQQYIFEEESAKAGAPRLIPFGIKMVAPVLMAFGSAAQQQTIPAADQLRARPGGVRDIRSPAPARIWRPCARARCARAITTSSTARRPGTRSGHFADWIFCLVRTDPEAKQQSGIILPADRHEESRASRVRPIALLDGGHEVNEMWFEDVRVPVENRVGEENRGWTYAKFLLGHERTNIAGIGSAKRELARLKRIAAEERKDGRPLLDDPLFAARIAQVEIDLIGARDHQSARAVRGARLARAPGPEASILKIKGTEITRRFPSC